uniref:histidine kinase n=1 Tax=Caulobacter sp. (strain K31) TaxID=366602 RepID=B0T738_CAUSK
MTPAVQFPIEPPSEDRPITKILIVDDDERNAFAAIQALEALGQELVVARSGEEALRKLLVDDYAVILLDLHMPGMDGYETAALIRQRRRNRDIPIVFLTAVFREETHIFKAYSAGAVDVVFKPVDPFILRSKVQVLVDLHLKTLELARQSEGRRLLLEENAQVHAEKLVAERSLRSSQERQQAILRALPIVFHSRRPDPPYAPLSLSEGVLGLTGFPPARFLDEPAFAFDRIHPGDRAGVTAAQDEARRVGAYHCEYRWLCADGQYRSLIDQGVMVVDDESGEPLIFGTILDNTERRDLEEALVQARKMEAVGQLTGGVAHDFNNLLTVILGNIELIQRRSGDEHPLARHVAAVRQAAERGGALTRQLLAFSRRQRLDPATVDIIDLVREFTPLLRQAVGEAVTIDLEIGATPVWVHVDAAQLESALLNLAVNARDAMDAGGVLSISARVEASAGAALAVISVRDTGPGMSEEIASRVFEPFFTTKEVGKGSGLGLSQVYGFVRQSGGEITLRSAPGQGATFEIRLPTTTTTAKVATAPATRAEDVAVAAAAPSGGETILVVEDDPAVLALAVDTLRSFGYRVTTASNAASALRRLRGRQAFDMLFSDVVMPGGVSGIELARRARVLRPDLKILLTSGFVGEEAEAWANEFPMIDKPYEPSRLVSRVRAAFDGDGPAEGRESPATPSPSGRGWGPTAKRLGG